MLSIRLLLVHRRPSPAPLLAAGRLVAYHPHPSSGRPRLVCTMPQSRPQHAAPNQSPRCKAAHVHPPCDACQTPHQVPRAHILHEGKVHEAHQRPERPAGREDGPEVGGRLRDDLVPVDARGVESAAAAQKVEAAPCEAEVEELGLGLERGHGLGEGVYGEGEEESVEGCGQSLVEEGLDEGVAEVEARGGRRLDLSGRLLGGCCREGLLEVFLPVTW